MPRTNGGGMLEKHVEKAVLAATAVALILVMALRVFSSPRQVQLRSPVRRAVGEGSYSPREVDPALRNMAEALKTELEGVSPPNDAVPDYPNQIRRNFANPYPVGQMPGMIVGYGSGGPKLVPTQVRELAKAELAELLPLPAPGKPLVAGHRELVTIPRTTKEGTQYDEKELVAAHAAFVVNHGTILKKWREALKDTGIRERLVVLAVEARRRTLLPDGRWSQPVPVSMVRVPVEAPFGPLPAFDEKKKNYDEVLAAVNAVADIRSQEWLLEPGYYDVYRDGQPSDWMDNKPRTAVSDLPGVEAVPSRLTGGVPRRTVRPDQRPVRPGEGMGSLEYERYMQEKTRQYQEQYGEGQPPRREPGMGPTGPPRREPPRREAGPGARPPRREVRRAPRREVRRAPRREVTQPPRREVQQPPRREPGYDVRPPREELPQVIEQKKPDSRVAALADQLSHEKGILEAWFHDTTLRAMETYSYQVRLVLFNPLFGNLKEVKKQEDANRLALLTPWSEWSEPVEVKRPTQFFLVGAGLRETVYVRVVTERWGHRVAKQFTVRRGDPIGEEVVMKLERLSGEQQDTPVSFKTGAVAVDFNFDRKVRVPNSSIVNTTVELLYLDADGQLRSRTLFDDQRKLRKPAAPAPAPVVALP